MEKDPGRRSGSIAVLRRRWRQRKRNGNITRSYTNEVGRGGTWSRTLDAGREYRRPKEEIEAAKEERQRYEEIAQRSKHERQGGAHREIGGVRVQTAVRSLQQRSAVQSLRR